jgi:DnaJ like chaperone protein
MPKYGKWIGGGLGFVLGGPIGAIIGFGLGSFFDAGSVATGTSINRTTSGDFTVSLLVLVAAVMKADGKVLRSELEFVRGYFVQSFGVTTAAELVRILGNIVRRDIPVNDVCLQIRSNMDYPSRLELLHFLYGIAKADGAVHESEANIIGIISINLGITQKDHDSIKAMFIDLSGAAYRILEIEPTATNDEVKSAYRTMAKKYHPDKVSHLGEEIQKTANEKFKKVNEAYEKIKNERGMP